MEANKIRLSNGETYIARLVVYKDEGKWRLFWENPDRPGVGVDEQSTVTGQPFFRTRKKAVAYGERRYGETAAKAQWQ